MPKGYGYGNARLRAMRSRLLPLARYEELLAKTKIEEVMTSLAETPYKADLEVALVRYSGLNCVFEALRNNLAQTLRQIKGFFEDSPRTLVDILLRRWDRHNLLTILRGQSQQLSADRMLPALTPVGQLDEVALRELARQPGLRAALELMIAWRLPYAPALRRVQPRRGTAPDLDQLELALNRFHYASLFETLGQGNGNRQIAREQLQSEVDLINIRTALRLARWPELSHLLRQRYGAADIAPLLIEPGGRLSVAWLAQLVGQGGGVEGIMRGLAETRYGTALEAGWRRYQAGEEGLTPFERELERWQAQQSAALFSGNPLSIAIPIAYLGCKEVEVANLRLIAQAVALDLKRETVRRELIIEPG